MATTDAEKILELQAALNALKDSEATRVEAARVSAVSVKLPPFWSDKTTLWFAQAEAQFALRSITEQKTKFNHVLAILDSKTAERAMDIIAAPGDTAYDDLKARLTGAFSLSDPEKAARLLDMTGLGDQTPSQLIDRMLMLVPARQDPGFLVRELFMRQLPTDVRAHLAQSSKTGTTPEALRELALEADRHFTSLGSRVTSVSKTSQEVADVNATSNRRRLCFFHARFGAKALKCSPPCDWKPSTKISSTLPNQENSKSGRNSSN